jgi:alpha-tubulin suppressor-like RCC1 family protein
VYAWGRGEHGRLGFGDDKSSHMVPQKVELLAGEDIIQVSCGGTHSVALTRDGRMFSVSVFLSSY